MDYLSILGLILLLGMCLFCFGVGLWIAITKSPVDGIILSITAILIPPCIVMLDKEIKD
jgi:hypothetical protein